MELFDIYDENNQPLNIIKERKMVHQDGDWHRTSQIWVRNVKGEVLCNLRSSTKDLFPLYWDLSIGGHVVAGDSYEATALREMEEEIGITAKEQELILLGDEKINGIDAGNNLIDREHARLFLYKTDRSIEDFKFQKEEIESLKFMRIDDLIAIIGRQDAFDFKVVPIKKHFTRILNLLKIPQ